MECVRYRELLELRLDPAPTPQSSSVVNAEPPIPPSQIDRDGVTGDTGLRPRQQPLLPQQPIDQRRFSGIGTADHGNADLPALGRTLLDVSGDVVCLCLEGRRRYIGECCA